MHLVVLSGWHVRWCNNLEQAPEHPVLLSRLSLQPLERALLTTQLHSLKLHQVALTLIRP